MDVIVKNAVSNRTKYKGLKIGKMYFQYYVYV